MAVNFDQFAHSIKITRKAAGLSQAQLAELAGVGKTLIFDIEKGHEEVSFSKLCRILAALNIDLELKLPFTPRSEDEIKLKKKNERNRRA